MDKRIKLSNQRSQSTWKKFFLNQLIFFSIMTIVCYVVVGILSKIGCIFPDWQLEVGGSYEMPSWNHLLGTDILGRSIVAKIIKGAEISIQVGLVVGCIAVLIGTTLGGLAGYFGGWVDALVMWCCSVITAVPNIMLLMGLSFVLGKGLVAMCWALGVTFWVDLCRLVRGEVLRHKNLEYVQAATVVGAGHLRKLFIHILPNISHVIIVQFSLLFQTAIKSEVILSYLGLGVQDGTSWGIMIDDAKMELMQGVWWQIVPATAAMFFIVLAFNILSDELCERLDPKLKRYIK